MKITVDFVISEDKIPAFMNYMSHTIDHMFIQKMSFHNHTDFLLYKTWCEANFVHPGKADSLHNYMIKNTDPVFIDYVKELRKYLVDHAKYLQDKSYYDERKVVQLAIDKLDKLFGRYL